MQDAAKSQWRMALGMIFILLVPFAAAIAAYIFFIPILVSTWYLLHQVAALLRWRLAGVVMLSFGIVALHAAAQLCYEPSGTGAPNGFIVPVWLGSVGMALIWAMHGDGQTEAEPRPARTE